MKTGWWAAAFAVAFAALPASAQLTPAYFTLQGYDLYRFDRQWIRDWPGDATELVDAVKRAKAMGYHRVILAGQSASAWVSLAATYRGAPVDGVIFKDDTYDAGGRTDDASAAFAKSGVESGVVAYPPGFSGHGAANDNAFPRKLGGCINAFIGTGARQPPCI